MVNEDSAAEAVIADRMITPVAVIAPDSTLQYINPAGAVILGQDRSWLMGRRMLDLVHPQDRARVARELRRVVAGRPSAGSTRYRLRAAAGLHWRTFDSTVDNLVDDPRVGGILVSSRDITEEMARGDALREAAYSHPVTGLPNRKAIEEKVHSLVAGEWQRVAVGFVGLERLDLIRHSLGHTTVDAIARAAAQRTSRSVPSNVFVGQFDDDTLALVYSGSAVDAAMEDLWRVVASIGQTMFVEGHELRPSASAGCVVADAPTTGDLILQDASLALHRAKSYGGGRVALFDPSLRQAARVRLELEADLRQAVSSDELWIALQPIVSLPSATPARSEALLRWDRDGAPVPPQEFIRVAEEVGLIIPIGDRVIEQASRLARSAPGGQILVNLSPKQLASPRLVERIQLILATAQCPSERLGFEVTETLLIEHFDYAADVIARIRQLGCPVGLDDFGTGYSSLSYLRRLPLDFIKIDADLIAGIDTDHEARSIVGATIAMATALNLDVIAEGVETATQAATLADLGCPHAQGYLFGRPTRPATVPPGSHKVC
jgi:diguanylate cyclase (GGDEF)-like protein/PAS domain S-box-containing protein